MRNSNPKIVEIIDERRPVFKCKNCGQTWRPSVNPGGRFRRVAMSKWM